MTPAMDSDGFRQWRRDMGLKQKDAADRLGLKKRVIQYYEKGDRDGKRVDIPRTVELACFALSRGCERDFGRRRPRAAAGRLAPPAARAAAPPGKPLRRGNESAQSAVSPFRRAARLPITRP